MQKNKIIEMSAEELYEVDGVVFDADSYARYLQHCEVVKRTEALPEEAERPPEAATPPEAEAPSEAERPPEEPVSAEPTPTPTPTFYTDPQHIGWYPEEGGKPPVPIMSGAVPPKEGKDEPAPMYFIAPVQTIEEVIRTPIGQIKTIVYGGGSGSGSYMTSYSTSFLTSYRYGSGSGSFFSSGSCIFAVGGYGLELI